MPNYNQTTISSGDSWTRSYQVIVNNKLNTMPSITFNEENVISTGTVTMSTPTGHINQDFNDPTKQFNLINPTDGTTVVGTATFQDVYVMLYSLYMAAATARDAGTTL